jgi:tetratricopeptide (TPR) repeat protein
MSPEQALGDPNVDGRSDTYSLACVTYEMLAGAPPFAGPTPQAVQARRAAGEVPSLVVVRDTVPAAMEAVILKALSRTPADRHQTTRAFAEALAQAADAEVGAVGSRRRSPALVSALAVVTVLVAAGLYAVIENQGRSDASVCIETAEAAPGVAVLPFRVSGSDVDHLREGMSDLLFANLDGMPGIRPIDPSTLLARWNERVSSDSMPDLATRLEVAASACARYAVAGSVVEVGPTIRLNASVYEISSGETLGQANETGPGDDPLNAVDRLTIAVVRALGPVTEDELARIDLGEVTTGHPEALKPYLRAQALYRRTEFEAAAEQYELAIAEDSTFGLAHLGLGWSLSWNPLVRIRGAERPRRMLAAVEHARTDRQELTARASLGWIPGFMDGSVVDELRQAVRAFPEDAHLWYLLGEHYLHVGTVTGAFDDHAQEAERAFERAVELVPDFAPYWLHLIDLAFIRADSLRAAELISELGRAAPDAGARNQALFHFAFLTSPGAPDFQASLDTLERLGDLDQAYSNLAHPRFWPAVEAVIERLQERWFARRDCDQRQRSLAVGRLNRFLTEAVGGNGESSCLHYARMLDLPVSEQLVDSVMVARLEMMVTAGSPGRPRDLGVQAYLVDREMWAEHDTVLAIWSANADSARAWNDIVFERYWGYWIAEARAYREWKTGRPDRAVEILERLPPNARLDPDFRWMLGNLYMELDRPADAARQFKTLQGVYYFAPNWTLAYYRLGEAYEQLGEPEKAHEQYAYVVETWRDADPELQPWVERARARMAAIAASR